MRQPETCRPHLDTHVIKSAQERRAKSEWKGNQTNPGTGRILFRRQRRPLRIRRKHLARPKSLRPTST